MSPEPSGAAPGAFPVLWPEEYRAHALSLGPGNALLRMGDAAPSELLPDPEALADPVGERRFSPVPFLVRKHRNRALVLATSRCFSYCRFCFRRSEPPGPGREPDDASWERVYGWLAAESEVEEVILSGGDPLTLPDDALRAVAGRLAALPAVRRWRLHTRAPVVRPDRVTRGLTDALSSALPLRVVVHANHPDELRPTVADALERLRDAGVSVLAQSVLLAGVNDDPALLADLYEKLRGLGVTPHYLHHPDRAPGNGRFRLPLRRGLALHGALVTRLGAGAPPYVVDLPSGAGKCPVAALEVVAEEAGPEGTRRRYRWTRPEGWDTLAPEASCEWWDVREKS